jgi:DNA-damage-inducible protein D
MAQPPAPRVSPFEQIRHEDEDGEFWSARELSTLLGYVQWRNFAEVVEKAEIACETSGHEISDHFADVSKMIPIGKGGKRKVIDCHLSRYACYLVVQNGDPAKRMIAMGQTYFAAQTRRAEILGDLSSMSEAQQRIILRDQLSEAHSSLNETLDSIGIEDYAPFCQRPHA